MIEILYRLQVLYPVSPTASEENQQEVSFLVSYFPTDTTVQPSRRILQHMQTQDERHSTSLHLIALCSGGVQLQSFETPMIEDRLQARLW